MITVRRRIGKRGTDALHEILPTVARVKSRNFFICFALTVCYGRFCHFQEVVDMRSLRFKGLPFGAGQKLT